MSILLGILTIVLLLVALFLVLVVLAQKSKDGGMGAALGGGAAEAAFGADTSNVLSKSTIYAAVIFFVLSFLLYLGRIYERNHGTSSSGSLPTITAPALPATPPAGADGTAPGAAAPANTAPITVPSPTPAATAPATTSTPAPAPAPDAKK